MKIKHYRDIEFDSIRNIIFDWGGVITNINYQATVEAFNDLGLTNFHEYYTQLAQNDLFKQYEVGAISSAILRNEIRRVINKPVSDEQIDKAWCAMLLDTPPENIELLRRVSKKFRIFLLSNTNDIHVNYYNNFLKQKFNIDYPALYEKVYYSHAVGKRKPNTDIFEYVLTDKTLRADETLFIDDTEMHVDAAAELGIRAVHLSSGLTVQKLFKGIV